MRMSKRFELFIICSIFLFGFTISPAQDIEVEEMVFCSSIEQHQPVGIDTVFVETVGTVYCFSKITGAADTVLISHVWYYNNEEKARVDLSIKSRTWRTWSSKRIMEDWQGKWRVDIIDMNGNILKSKQFFIKSL
jgi:hypothetical protein